MMRVQQGFGQQHVAGDLWQGVSAKRPCPVCGGSQGCFVHDDDAFASCSQSPSEWPLVNGAWLHRIAELDGL